MLLEFSVILLESSITLLANIYSTGITHDDSSYYDPYDDSTAFWISLNLNLSTVYQQPIDALDLDSNLGLGSL
jgi:hypothetical protein